tara:strand:- start:340 stop:1485 length:1146 start_codon:yes stop_codon:yes gene_type:complete
MKIALIHDGIFCKGGAERVLLNMHKAFPDAPIYTSIYLENQTYAEFKKCNIKTSFLQYFIKSEKTFKKTFVLFAPYAMRKFDLSKYDVILSSTTHCAKYIKPNKTSLVINYCYTPFRLAWNPESYRIFLESNGYKKFLIKKVISYLQKIDFHYAQRANKYIAMTQETSERIKKIYNIKPKNIKIINPSINVGEFKVADKIEDYFLIVSRLEKYKKVDLAIKAFNKTDFKLKIVGMGMEYNNLKKIANNNIKFLNIVSQSELINLYSKCKALIFPQHEDYGLTPLEVNASGRPVIAYGLGGVETTMIPSNKKDNKNFTSIFFLDQNEDSLLSAIKKLDNLNVNSEFILNHVKKFDNQKFISKLKSYIQLEYKNHINTNSYQS